MSGVLNVLLASGGARRLHSDTVTVGNNGTDFGFQSGVFGSVGDSTFDDAGGNSRTIRGLYDAANAVLVFVLDGLSVPNTDATFKYIVVNGVVFQRAIMSYTADTGTGDDTGWTGGAGALPNSGTVSYEIWG